MPKANRIRIVLLLIFGLFLHKQAEARQRAYGNCEIGASVVTTAGITSSSQVQASYAPCTVTVYIAGTVTLVTNLYSDNANSPLTNPFQSGNDGRWFFYADDGRYDVKLSGGGIPTPFTMGDIKLNDFLSAVSVIFAQIGSAALPQIKFCSDCQIVTPCVGGGSGAWAFSNGTIWKCPF